MSEFCDWGQHKIRKPNYIALYTEKGVRACRECYTPSFKTDGLLTRNSQRITDQQNKYKNDFEPPHIYNKATRKMEINPRFVELYPDKLRYYETEDSVAKAGYPGLAKAMKKQKENIKREKAEFQGRQERKMRKLVK